MGMRYPVEARCRLPEAGEGDRSPGGAALVEAVGAYRAAVRAAAGYAVAVGACRALDAEVAQTRHTLRALTRGRIPQLEAALHEATARLDESERAELVRLRWAAVTRPVEN
jgi:vacuolar-type H+-ATPase subunit D/Vma8